ncbi:MAG: alpha/beta fold hydrolase [Chloroflexota bacterium]
MPIVTLSGQRIYYETAGAGHPLLLHHGFTQSAEDWKSAGWTDALGASRRLIIMDMLGHGRSHRPHDVEAYRVPERVRHVLAVADDAGAERFDMLGFSLGGRTAFALAARHPERVRGMAVGGMHARAPSLSSADLLRRAATLRRGKVEAIQRALGTREGGHEMPPPDPEALALSTEALLSWEGAAHALPRIKTPTIVFAGQRDPLYQWAKEDAEAMPAGIFHDSGDVTHRGTFMMPKLSAPAVDAFLKGLNKRAVVS